MDAILGSLSSNSLFSGYGRMTAGVISGLDFGAMNSFARGLEGQGYIKFGCPAQQYCARFARQVARAGGASFAPWIFTGQQNVNAAGR